MSRIAQRQVLGAAVLLAAVFWAWHAWWPDDERAIRRRLDELVDAVNQEATDGLGSIGRAAQVGSYFTDDVVVELGYGVPPIHGREPLMAMAARFQPRGAGYTLDLDDVSVTVAADGAASDVSLAATLTRRNPSAGEPSADARELQLAMMKIDGVWRIARVTAVDTLRRQ